MINIVLFQPLIPQNTGNIIRTCVALGIKLHLVEPLGFSLEEKYLKRSALDYFKKVNLTVYKDNDDFFSKTKGKYFYYSRYGLNDYTKAKYKDSLKEEIYLIFGKETTGIDKEILRNNLKYTYRIPTTEDVRSINLSNCVALVAYHAFYKIKFKSLSMYEPEIYKGKNFLKNYGKED